MYAISYELRFDKHYPCMKGCRLRGDCGSISLSRRLLLNFALAKVRI